MIATMISTFKFERYNHPFTIKDILKGEFNWNMYEITQRFMQWLHVYCTDYVLNNIVFLWGVLLDTLMQIIIMLRHLVAEILRFKFDDYRILM